MSINEDMVIMDFWIMILLNEGLLTEDTAAKVQVRVAEDTKEKINTRAIK